MVKLTAEQEWAIDIAAEASYKLIKHNDNKPTGDDITHRRWKLTRQQLLLALQQGVNGMFISTSRSVSLRVQIPDSYRSIEYFYNGMFRDHDSNDLESFFGTNPRQLLLSSGTGIELAQDRLAEVTAELEKLIEQFKPSIVAMELL